jgi:hypothetical protein
MFVAYSSQKNNAPFQPVPVVFVAMNRQRAKRKMG